MLPVERTGLGCIPEGRNVTYECTVSDDDDGSLTLWRGSVFNCSNGSDMIRLSHSMYEPNGVTVTCGDLSAMSVEISGNDYTSRLTLTATAVLNGTTIECSRNGIGISNDTLKTGSE